MEARYCSSCGQHISPNARFCGNCGNPLEQLVNQQQATQQPYYQQPYNQQQTYQPPVQQQPMYPQQAPTWQDQQSNSYEVPLEEWLRLFTRSPRYIEKWNRNSKWNWASFTFNPVWFAYRKMYAECAIYVSIMAGLALLELLLGFSLRGAYYAIYIFNGTLGNKLYYRKARKEIDNILLLHGDTEIRRHLILQKGGTSGWGIVFGILLVMVEAFVALILEEAL